MKTKLFCFPHAGGSANLFLKWDKYLDSSISLFPVELPGRGRRYQDPLCDSMAQLLTDICNQISTELPGARYALFGHSMGSLVSFELAYRLLQLGHNPPVHIFFSGFNAPGSDVPPLKMSELPGDKLRDRLISFGGTPPEIFSNAEVRELFLPIIIADLKIADACLTCEDRPPLDISFSIMYGKDDQTLYPPGISGWQKHTSRECVTYPLPGEHMYLDASLDAISAIINKTLI